MEIQINGYPIEFALEKEKSVKDVVESLTAWAKDRELIFSEIWVDNARYFVEDAPNFSLDGIGTINCIIVSKAELVADSIFEASEYCERMMQFIDSAVTSQRIAADDCKKMHEGLGWLIEVAHRVLNLLGISPADFKYRDKSAQMLLDELKNFQNEINTSSDLSVSLLKDRKNILSDLRDFFRIVLLSDEMRKASITSIDSPDAVISMIAQLVDEIPIQRQNIERAASAYHGGKDVEASRNVESFIDFVYRYLRTCYHVKPLFGIDVDAVVCGEKTLSEKNNELNELLNQMLQCLENSDIVGLTDVLEYEFLPALDDIEKFCKAIFDMLQSPK
ncbi:MAG: hypothetical protein N2316_02270 [Spirochaetes bacterium]|nr:hypothetical protein [Spirochaetota bacterium]